MRRFTIVQEKRTRINEEINERQVRLIDSNGQQVGVVSIEEALKAAEKANLDLVEISPTAQPPVCKVIDFGKFKYEQAKKIDEAKKKQKQVQVKEIKFRPSTDDGDYAVKLRSIKKFLLEGNKVKVSLRFRGREMAHQQLGLQLLDRVKVDLQEEGAVEQYPKLEGRQMIMMLAPQRKKK
ncbi:MAG: translation initiation factor IF-3 [Neisseriaceae bacterium]